MKTLYKLDSKGKVRSWQIEVIFSGYFPKIVTTAGLLDGGKTTTEIVITEGKNIGRSNETTALQQAEFEARATWNSKVRSGYVEDMTQVRQAVPFAAIKAIPQNDTSVFCHRHGIYQIITDELVEFVGNEIGDLRAIEIGAGNGCLGRTLGIPLTDSKIQTDAQVKKFYKDIGQPPVIYPPDVKKLDALSAVKVLKAEAAVGSWVTHKYKSHLEDGFFGGVDEMILSKRLKKIYFRRECSDTQT